MPRLTVGGWFSESRRRAARPFLDRTESRDRLRRALWSQKPRVIVVTGPAGVGKTELVTRVLHTFQLLRIRDVRHDTTPAAGLRNPVIVLDSGRHLLDADGRLRDPALEDKLAAGRATAILITETPPRPRPGRRWLDPADIIEVDGLPLRYFKAYARRLPGRHLASLDHRTQERLCGYFQGVPRLAQLFAGVGATPGGTAADLADRVHDWMRQPLDWTGVRDLLLAELHPWHRDVHRAITAVGVPVRADEVAELTGLDLAATGTALAELAGTVIHERDTGLYRVPESPSDQDPEMAARAAELLATARGGQVTAAAALAEVGAWLRADLPDRAFAAIREMDTGVRPDELFRTVRQELADVIDPRFQAENLHALGRLHYERGDYEAAWDDLQQALHRTASDDRTRAAIRLDLARLALARGDVGEALLGFEHVRDHPRSPGPAVAAAVEEMRRITAQT